MIQTIEKGSLPQELEYSEKGAQVQSTLSDSVIPAVPGEFYDYSAEFTEERPLYALLKCKANKNRPIAAAKDLGNEVNLLFQFGDRNQVCSVRTANASGLLGDSINGELFGKTWIAPAGITAKDFYKIRSRKDIGAIVEICQTMCAKQETFIALHPGMIITMMTDGGKYGLFSVTSLTATSVQIDACHILL